MLDKAPGSGADAIVLDLEDSVPPAEKESARLMVRDRLSTYGPLSCTVTVRVNAVSTGLTAGDLAAVVVPGLQGLVLPKCQSADEMRELDRLMSEAERRSGLRVGEIPVIACVETAYGVLRTEEIANAGPRVAGLNLGAEDFCADMGVPRTKEATELFLPRAMIALCSKAAEIQALDCVFSDFSDEAGLRHESTVARGLGYNGKFVIHPNQIGPVNEIFTPPPAEVEQARRVVEAFASAVAAGSAAVSLDGKMVDTPVVNRARKLLALAELLAKGR
jgi:citrate lyase subunit beta/citryl-CoA lyase